MPDKKIVQIKQLNDPESEINNNLNFTCRAMQNPEWFVINSFVDIVQLDTNQIEQYPVCMVQMMIPENYPEQYTYVIGLVRLSIAAFRLDQPSSFSLLSLFLFFFIFKETLPLMGFAIRLLRSSLSVMVLHARAIVSSPRIHIPPSLLSSSIQLQFHSNAMTDALSPRAAGPDQICQPDASEAVHFDKRIQLLTGVAV